jgi:hypothetical protein
LLAKFLLFSAFAPERTQHRRMMLRGFADGISGRYGRHSRDTAASHRPAVNNG